MLCKSKVVWFKKSLLINGKKEKGLEVEDLNLNCYLITNDCLIELEEPWTGVHKNNFIKINNKYYYHATDESPIDGSFYIHVVDSNFKLLLLQNKYGI